MVLVGALCVLPDAINIQHFLLQTFEPGVQTISYSRIAPADEAPDEPESPIPPRVAPPPYPKWLTRTLHTVFFLPAALVTLLTICALERIQSGKHVAGAMSEAIAIYKRAIRLAPAFLWVSFLQFLVPAVAGYLFGIADSVMPGEWDPILYVILVSMIFLVTIAYLWLYFAQYALIFAGKHSFHALLFSRDLVRKRFFKVATRIVVFMAVWSGFNSWSVAAAFLATLIIGPVGVATGTLGGVIFMIAFAFIAITFATTAFFVAAGLRLYQDLLPAPVAASSAAG